MTWLFKYILKIKNKTLMSILTVVNSVITLCLMGGFIALPFIKYGENARDFFFILWGVCVADFLAEMILTSKRRIAQNEKEARRYNNDKVVYWVSTVASVLMIAFALLLFLLKNNYGLDIELYDIAVAFLGALILTALVTNLLAMYKDNYKQMAFDGAVTLLSVFSVICIMSGLMAIETNPEASKILIGGGAIFLFIVIVRKVFIDILSITIDKISSVWSAVFWFAILGAVVGVVLRYIVDDCKLQEILTTIFAAIMGGIITLAGVAWTIQKTNSDKKEEEKKKYKPFVNFYGEYDFDAGIVFTCEELAEMKNSLFRKSNDGQKEYIIANLVNINTDFAAFCWCGIVLNQEVFYIESKAYIDKKDYFGLSKNAVIYSEEEVEYLALILQDLLGNEYKLPIKFKMEENTNRIIIKDVGFVCDIDTEECDEQF